MKKVIVLAISFLIASSVIAEKTHEELANLKDPFEKGVTFKGVASPFITTTIKYGYNDSYRGIITYTASQGTIFFGPTFDENGKVIKKGDPLIKLKTAYREAAYKAQQAALMEAEADLVQKKENFTRYETLVASKSVSTEDYQQARAAYFTSVGQYEQQKANLVEVKALLDLCTYHAQFTGIVDKVVFPAGLCAGELDVMQVSQLFPMGIEVDMPRELANKITSSTPVMIYSEFSDKPLGVGHGLSILTDKGIKFLVDNYLLTYKKDGKDIQNVHSLHTVLPIKYFAGEGKPLLSVEKEALKKDEKGYFVWQAVGQKNYVPGKGVDHIFKLQKVKVVPGDAYEKPEPGIESVYFKDAGTLQAQDITISDVPDDFTDGSEVYYSDTRFLFMPGDPVKVVIGPEN